MASLVFPQVASTKPLSHPVISSQLVVSVLCITMWVLCLVIAATQPAMNVDLQTVTGP